MDRETILNSDPRILDVATQKQSGGVVRVAVPAELFGDSKGFAVDFQGDTLSHTQLLEFCNMVRGEYNERIERKAAKEAKHNAARDNDSQRRDRGPGESCTSGVSKKDFVPDAKETVESLIKSEVLRLRNLRDSIKHELTALNKQAREVAKDLSLAEKALEVYDAPKDSRQNSKKNNHNKKGTRGGESRGAGGQDNGGTKNPR